MLKEDEFGITRCPNPELCRLEGLFEPKLWSPVQARMILAGIHPESAGECRDSMGVSYHYISLPGTKEKYDMATLDCFDFHKSIEDSEEGTIGYLRGFILGESQTPAFWVQKAIEKHYQPPWFAVAQNAQLIPIHQKRTVSENAQYAAIEKAKSSPSHDYKKILLQDWDQLEHPINNRKFKEFKVKHRNGYADHSGDRRPKNGDSSIDKWSRHLRKDSSGEKTETWIGDIRREFQL